MLVSQSMGETGFEDDKACRVVFRNVSTGGGADMHSAEISTGLLFALETALDLFKDGILVQLFGTVLGKTCDAWLG